MFQQRSIIKNFAIIASTMAIISCNGGSSSTSLPSPNDTITACGDNMTIIQSNATTNYTFATRYSSGTLDNLYGVEYINNLFITVGGSTIMTSTDGNKWTKQVYDGSSSIYHIAYGNNFYLGVGPENTLVYTTNAKSKWYPTNPSGVSADNVYSDVVFANGIFVFVGFPNTRNSYAITGTVTGYNNESIQSLESFAPLDSITFGESVFIAVGESGQILKSTNGTNWSAVSNPSNVNLSKVRFINNLFIAVGNNGLIETSPDGNEWTIESSGSTFNLYDVSYLNGNYIVSGDHAQILISTNTVNWSQVVNNASSSLHGLATSLTTVVAVGDKGIIETSTNASDWSFAQSGIRLVSIGANAESYWIIGNDAQGKDIGVIMFSNDGGKKWDTHFESSVIGASQTFYGNGTVVVTSFYGNIITSTDQGQTWKQVYSGNSPLIFGIYANGIYTVVGYGGVILTSSDGVTFTQESSETTNDLRGVAYNNGIYIVVGDDGTILYSNDKGHTWSHQHVDTGHSELKAVTYANGIFLISGDNGQILTSTDGVNWIPQLSIFPAEVNASAFGNNGWYVVGSYGFIQLSNDNGSKWKQINSGTQEALYTVISNIN